MSIWSISQSGLHNWQLRTPTRASKHKPIIISWEHPSHIITQGGGGGRQTEISRNIVTTSQGRDQFPAGWNLSDLRQIVGSKTLAQIVLDKIRPYGDIYANQLGTWTCTDMIYRMVPVSSNKYNKNNWDRVSGLWNNPSWSFRWLKFAARVLGAFSKSLSFVLY